MFDFGGGKLDVSLLDIEDGVFEVIATAGKTHFGGGNFDHLILQECIKHFEDLEGINLNNVKNHEAISRLRTQCEMAKCMLSSRVEVVIQVMNLVSNIDFVM